jgi:hypothetical protein
MALISRGAKGSRPSGIERTMFSAAAKDDLVARRFHDYSTRNDGPRAFMGPRNVFRAVWVDAIRRRPPQ